jgi:SAM-dependent methyltransferase
MQKFRVSADDFYRVFSEDAPRIDACMGELIERYDIRGKSVLSIGAGAGREEQQFALAGNDLLLIDIDEQGSLQLRLQEMPESRGLEYWIGDAAEFEQGVGTHDVVYLSGFTPDEARRSAIVKNNAEIGRSWDPLADPFHPVVMQYAASLRDNGLLLIQSYCGSIEIGWNPDYLAACRRQLGEIGLHLLEIHRFKDAYGVLLYTAVKGKPRIAPATKISRFHGRADPQATVRVFGATAASISPAEPPTPAASSNRKRVYEAILRIVAWTRYIPLRVAGCASANPKWKLPDTISDAEQKIALREIIGRFRFKTALNLHCGFGRNARILQSFTDSVLGIDTIDAKQVTDFNQYIRLEPGDEDCLAQISSGTVDAAFVLNVTGFHPHSTWRAYLSSANPELWLQLQEQNLPRVLAKGGLLICCEWESEPERRWGRTSWKGIDGHAAFHYDAPDRFDGFELIACGLTRSTRSPFVMYRKI